MICFCETSISDCTISVTTLIPETIIKRYASDSRAYSEFATESFPKSEGASSVFNFLRRRVGVLFAPEKTDHASATLLPDISVKFIRRYTACFDVCDRQAVFFVIHKAAVLFYIADISK